MRGPHDTRVACLRWTVPVVQEVPGLNPGEPPFIDPPFPPRWSRRLGLGVHVQTVSKRHVRSSMFAATLNLVSCVTLP